MRKRVFAALVILMIVVVSCSTNESSLLSKDGLGPVRLGYVIKSIPGACEGLYDQLVPKKVEEYDYEATVYRLKMNGETIATVIEDAGKVHAIEVYSERVKTSDGFGLNKTAEEIILAGGEAYCDNYGFEGILYKGMLFSGMKLTKSGQRKAEDAYLLGVDPIFFASDFETNAKPTQITLAGWYAKAE